MGQAVQPPLFKMPPIPASGWRPSELVSSAQVYWATPAEITSRLDAVYYVITRRQDRLVHTLKCRLSPLSTWAEVNPPARRLPSERGYILHEYCVYGQIRDLEEENCWVFGVDLPPISPRQLPGRAAYTVQSGDLLLPRIYSSLHKSVWAMDTTLPLMASDTFAVLKPHSREQGLALLALLHHRVLGEQLWALTSGTTVRAISASKLGELQVPLIAPDLMGVLASRVEVLLYAQTNVFFPGVKMPLSRYWQEAAHWQQRMKALMQEIHELIIEALH